MAYISSFDADELLVQLSNLYARLHRGMRHAMADYGLSFAKLKLLMFIDYHGPVRSSDIIDAFGYAPRSVTEAIDVLERAGLARRDPDPLDRRAKRITLTEKGQRAVQGSEPIRRAFITNAFCVLDAEQQRMFELLIGQVNDQLDKLDKADAFGHAR